MSRPSTKFKSAPTKAVAPVTTGKCFPLWLLAALLALVTVALYWPATGYDFINFDDPDYVTANLHIQGGFNWEGLKWACLNPVCGNWHPLTVVSHVLDCQIYGLKPWGHHFTNVMLHALNTVLVLVLLQQMTGARWRSLFVAVLFAVHPLRVESVAWVAERKDVLSGFFGLLALVCYVRYTGKAVFGNQWSVSNVQASGMTSANRASPITDRASCVRHRASLFYVLSLSCFALGLMSKPMLVTWPFVMLLLDYWPLKRMQDAECGVRSGWGLSPQLLWEKIPFLALAVAASVITFVVQKREGALLAAESLPLSARSGNALISYVRYLGKFFWPTDLAIYYPYPGHWPMAKVLMAGGLILGLSVLFLAQRRRFPFVLMGWLWFVGMLVPVIGLVQAGSQAMADRYTYLPSLGLLMLAVWAAFELARRWRHHEIALSVAGAAAVALCLALTRQQLGYWRDSETLFRHAIEVTEGNAIAHNSVGSALAEKGQVEEAIRHYREALGLRPDYADAHVNLGTALGEKGQIEEAIRQYREALHLEPDYAMARYRLGNLLAKKGQLDEAISQYHEAIRLQPDYAGARVELGTTLGEQGQTDEAIRQYREALRLKPDHASAHYNLGNALARKGQIEEAIGHFQQAISLKPDHVDARNNLGVALYQQGRIDEAVRQFQEVLRLKPDYAGARRNLDAALAAKADPPK